MIAASAPVAVMPGSKAATAPSTEPHYDFLIKVTRRKRRQPANAPTTTDTATAPTAPVRAAAAAATATPLTSSSASSSRYEIQAECLGVIGTAITFDKHLCDFQVLQPAMPAFEPELPLLTSSLANVPPTSVADVSAYPSQPGLKYLLPPAPISAYDYVRDYHFANHDNANAVLRQQAAKKKGEQKSEQKGVAVIGESAASKADGGEIAAAGGSASEESEGEGESGGEESGAEEEGEAEGEEGEEAGALKRGRKPRRFFIGFKVDSTDCQETTGRQPVDMCAVCSVGRSRVRAADHA